MPMSPKTQFSESMLSGLQPLCLPESAVTSPRKAQLVKKPIASPRRTETIKATIANESVANLKEDDNKAPPLVKLSGCTTIEHVIAALREGVDFIGLDLSPTTGLEVAKAKRMAQLVRQSSLRYDPTWGTLPICVATFPTDTAAETINALAAEVGFAAIQFQPLEDQGPMPKMDGVTIPVMAAAVSASAPWWRWRRNTDDVSTLSPKSPQTGDENGETDESSLDNDESSSDEDNENAERKKIQAKPTGPIVVACPVDGFASMDAAALAAADIVDLQIGCDSLNGSDFMNVRYTIRAIKRAFPSYFGVFGGQFAPEIMIPALLELEKEHLKVMQDTGFLSAYKKYAAEYAGRPSLLYKATKLTESVRATSQSGKGATIWLKREDLLHTGSDKITNAVGQALLAKWLNKTRVITETGSGQHGVAAASVCALFGLKCRVFMGITDMKRQPSEVLKMKALGAEVVPVKSGAMTLNDAVNEALRDLTSAGPDTYYLIRSCLGPHPLPTIVRDFQSIIGQEAYQQCLDLIGNLPTKVIAAVGGGSNAIGMFDPFIAEPGVELIGVEAGGDEMGRNSASLCKGTVGFIHGTRTYLLENPENGQIKPTNSISPGLDYPGVGPELAFLKDMGRVRATSVSNEHAIEGFRALARTEGILASLESAHAIYQAVEEARGMNANEHVLCCLAGRGDKDISILQPWIENM